MPLTFLHTADWQLGKPFSSVRDDGKRHRLQQERLHAVQRLAGLVQEAGAAFVLVAGDVFDSPQATKATVSAACAAIGSIGVPVLVIPGNHDHGGAGSIWEQEFFKREWQQLAPNLQVLTSPSPVVMQGAVIFPAPLLRRHEPGDPTAWIRSAIDDPALPAGLPRIVLAHGTIQGFGSSQDDEDEVASVANWIDLTRLADDGIDYIALGDWHGTKQVGPRAWYSGTPEIDRFPKGVGNDPGHVLRVTLSRGATPQVETLRTTGFSWKAMDFRFGEDGDLDRFVAALDEEIGTRGDAHLLSLLVEGSLGIAAASRLEEILESWDSRLVRLKLDNRVTVAPSAGEIGELTQRVSDPLIANVAAQLVARMDGDDEDAAIARLALRELHAALS
ncbi:DNA repair exonuclease [Luteolibacter flavescens]|uniref:DNA repair exonuclease n=1 Tax=Luteolibacter flavescens TaxID=1859460 RepID=A0ABT3FR57_9BACT|nr:DNA repair exonuclease [Luteolibacter flavescens]MCW1886063.1 DNA repair exonuclease [Luteolibacter flavescens]